jgi:hypothetical protein
MEKVNHGRTLVKRNADDFLQPENWITRLLLLFNVRRPSMVSEHK